jgi:hypothetical protein
MNAVANEGQTFVNNFVNPQLNKSYQLATAGPSMPSMKTSAPSQNNFNFGSTNNVQQSLSSFSAQAKMSRDVTMKASTQSFLPDFSVSGSGNMPV